MFVKFRKWNEKTLSNIVDNRVYFSTVFEFNDINEYNFLYGSNERSECLRKHLENGYINNHEYQRNLIKYSKERSSLKYRKSIAEHTNNGSLLNFLKTDKCFYKTAGAVLAYSKVGIFSVSHSSVFDDDSASLMFAHYAENLTGVALIYEIEDSRFCKVKYDNMLKGSVSDPKQWLENKYENNNMHDFLRKQKEWEYEKEYRVFSTPGPRDCKDFGCKLKAILYTGRFSGNESIFEAISKIYNEIYDQKLLIKQIYLSPSSKKSENTNDSHYSFKCYDQNQLVKDFIEQEIYQK